MRQRSSVHEDLEALSHDVDDWHPEDSSINRHQRRGSVARNQHYHLAMTKWGGNTLAIYVAAVLTYSYHNAGYSQTNVQVAIMTVITLIGASPASEHLTTGAIGAFVGGHNIIGATGLDNVGLASSPSPKEYLWLLVLASAVGWIWSFLIAPFRVLDGYAGRLGTTTFLGMNVILVTLWGPLKVVDWNRYYFGFVRIVHIAEESDAPKKIGDAWLWTTEAELAFTYILAVVWSAVVPGTMRIYHDRRVRQWQEIHRNSDTHNDPLQSNPPKPLNNVLVPVLWALLSILLVNMTEYDYAPGVYNGFAVGAYVAMASLQKIPSPVQFASVGLVAAAWGLILTPFFVGFAGKAGFTAMMGHVTHKAFLEPLFFASRSKSETERSQELESPSSSPSLSADDAPQSSPPPERPLVERRPWITDNLLQDKSSDEEVNRHSSAPKQEPQYAIRKPVTKQKQAFSTKQLRRQQQRLRNLEKQRQREQQQNDTTLESSDQQEEPQTPLLHHRAWSLVPVQEGDLWQHPKLQEDYLT